MDHFCPFKTNWPIFGDLIWKAGFSFGPNFPRPFSVTKLKACESFLSKQFTFKRKETTNLCVLLLKGDAKLAENVTITFQNDKCNMVNLMQAVENLEISHLLCPMYTRLKLHYLSWDSRESGTKFPKNLPGNFKKYIRNFINSESREKIGKQSRVLFRTMPFKRQMEQKLPSVNHWLKTTVVSFRTTTLKNIQILVFVSCLIYFKN